MLKNCFLPINYNKTFPQTCGEIIHESLEEFIINCKLCQIKIFAFEEFVQHFKKVHLYAKQLNDPVLSEPENEENHELILKIEIEEEPFIHNNSEIVKSQSYNSTRETKYVCDDHNNEYSGEYKDDLVSENDEDEEDEEPVNSIMRKNRKPKELSCKICSKKYADYRRLRLHVQLAHLQEKPYKCTTCDQGFTQERLLKSHITRIHIGYECPKCNKNFSTNRTLKQHMLIHLDKKEFICTADKCGKAFSTKKLLQSHQRYHTVAQFICEECGYKCWKRESLIVHRRNHTGDKPFSCELCDRRFASKPLLTEHMAAHESERKHICDVCGKSFNRPKALYHHKHLHLGIKKFVCKICGQAYAQAAGLSAHTRKHREAGVSVFPDNPFCTNNANVSKIFKNS